MSKWESLQLNKIAGLVMGQSPSSDSYNTEGEGMPFFQGKSDFGKVNPKIRMYCKSPKKLAHKNDILLSVRAPVGDVNIAEGTCCIGRGLAAISGQKEKSYSKYIYYYLLWKKKELENIGVGSTFKAIGKKDIEKILIPLPPLDIQKKIAAALDTANALIEKRKEQIEKLDLLIKSQFIEMFGDPVTNPKGWERTPMGKYIALLTDFSANGSYEYLDSNIVMSNEPGYALMVRTTDLEKNDFEKDVKYIDIKAYEILKKSKLFGNEIIINKIGSAGKVYIMPVIGKPASLGRNAFMIRYKSDINIKFIYYLLVSRYGEREIQKHIRGAVTKTITKEAVKSIQILCPPLYLQTQFAEFVEKVEAQKTLLQKSLADMEQNYQSLLQKCFKGEIF